jgi:hypothetical protein
MIPVTVQLQDVHIVDKITCNLNKKKQSAKQNSINLALYYMKKIEYQKNLHNYLAV